MGPNLLPCTVRWVGCVLVGVDFGVLLTPEHGCASEYAHPLPHDTAIVNEDRLRLSKLYPDNIFGCKM
jgi:hypothetical protein